MLQINQKEEKEEKKEKPRPRKPSRRPVKKPVRKPTKPKKRPSRPSTQPKKVVKPVVIDPRKQKPRVSPSKVGKTRPTRKSGPQRHTGNTRYESRKAQRHTNYSLFKDDTAGKKLNEEKQRQKQ